MVVLAASICTKNGKGIEATKPAVLSRQFVDMTRSRIEGLLSTFPKLTTTGNQHTYVETDSVRYVYQPLEDLFLLLITNKTSNILQDIETLALFSRVIGEYCRSPTEKEISVHAFELLSVFDEIISLGYRENVTLGQLRTIAAMESHDERIQAEIERNKEKEAKEELKRKAKQMDMQKKENLMAKTSGSYNNSSNNYSSAPSRPSASGGMGYSSAPTPAPQNSHIYPPQSSGYTSAPLVSKGMQLGSKPKNSSLLETIKADEGIVDLPQRTAPVTSRVKAASPIAVNVTNEEGYFLFNARIHIFIEEKISACINRDGGVQSFELNGTMNLKINDADKSKVRLLVAHKADSSVQFKTHPNVDKAGWSNSSAIGLKDSSRSYPIAQPLGILRWRQTAASDIGLPLSVNCWPSPTGTGLCDVNIEYELLASHLILHDTIITIPYPGSTAPIIQDIQGDYKVDKNRKVIIWTLPLIDSDNSSGTLEFNVSGEDPDLFFPITVSFSALGSLINADVTECKLVDGGDSNFSLKSSLISDSYQIV